MEDIYNRISKLYENDRYKNSIEEDKRLSEVYCLIPRIEEIDDIFRRSGCEAAKIALTSTDAAEKERLIVEYRRKTEALNREKLQLLEEHGYPVDYLQPIYTCPVCHDTGNDGMKKCECFGKRVIEQNYIVSGMKDILEKENFDTFNTELYPKSKDGFAVVPYEHIKAVLKRLHEKIDEYGKDSPCNIIFAGKTGVGKTFLCNCVAKALLDKGASLYYTSAFKLFNDFSESKFNHKTDNIDLDFVLECDVLVIDDLGAEIQTSVSNAYFVDIINQRVRRGASTVISTNFDIKEIFDKYGERIGSRFAQHYSLYNIYGNDIRMIR